MKTQNFCGIIVKALCLSLALPIVAHAQVAAPADDAKRYAVVDMQAVILNVSEGKAARAKLEAEIKAKEAELQNSKTELDKLNSEWKNQAPLLSESARLKKQQDFQEKFLELRNKEMAFQKEIKEKEQVATQKIAMDVTRMVNDLAKRRNYDMVFESNSAGLLFLKNPQDITKEVIDLYEKQSKKNSAKSK